MHAVGAYMICPLPLQLLTINEKLHMLTYKLTEQHVLQNQVIDLQAMLVAFMACLVPLLPHLNRYKPASHLFTLPAATIIANNAVGLSVLDILSTALLLSRPSFHGSTGNA